MNFMEDVKRGTALKRLVVLLAAVFLFGISVGTVQAAQEQSGSSSAGGAGKVAAPDF